MANNDLQQLYKMRDLLKTEEYVTSFNKNIDQQLINAVNGSIPELVKNKDEAYKKYQNVKEKAVNKIEGNSNFWILIIYIALVAIALLISLFQSSDFNASAIHILCTSIWVLLFIMKEVFFWCDYIPIKLFAFLAFAANAILLINFVSGQGVEGFWGWLGAVIVLILWPISNFFFLGPVVWLSLVSFFVSLIYLFASFSVMTPNADDKKANQSKADQTEEVKQAKAEYQRAYDTYCAAYWKQHGLIKGNYQKMKKRDTYTAEKKAMLNVIPANLQNMDMVNKLIWCIEQRFAYDIVSARNWYVQQEHNEAMQKKMQAVANELNQANRIQAQAAAEAAEANKAILAAIENQTYEQTKAINNQTDSMTKQMEKLNQTARENADANKETATYAGKIYREF